MLRPLLSEKLILGLTIGLSALIAMFPPCSYHVRVGNMNRPGAGPLPVWVSLRVHRIKREQINGRNRAETWQPQKYEDVTVAWYSVVQSLTLLWACSLAILIYRHAIRLDDGQAVFWYVFWRMGLTGHVLGAAIVPGISLLEPWAQAVPSQNPFLSISPDLSLNLSWIVASILTLIMTGLGTVAGLIVGALLGSRACWRVEERVRLSARAQTR